MDDLLSFTVVAENADELNQYQLLDPVYINLLPGEEFSCFYLLNYGCRFGLTNYRIILIFDNVKTKELDKNKEKSNNNFNKASKIISIPIGLIYHIEYYGLVCLTFITKIVQRISITFPDIELCEKTIKNIRVIRQKQPFSIDFFEALSREIPNHFLLDKKCVGNDWLIERQLIEMEFDRLKFSHVDWRISEVNVDTKLCSSYPNYHIVLRQTEDEILEKMAKFRSKKRFVTVSYKYRESGALIMRAGQPMTGMSNCRSSYDEQYIQDIIKITRSTQFPRSTTDNSEPKFKIFDARSYASAQLNRVHGGGMESDAYYSECSVEFLNIPNMHAVRSSFESLSACLSTNSESFYDSLHKTNWLQLILQLLACSCKIAQTVANKQTSVLVHCTDGWDRTPQLVSLSQLILDPFYRKIQGFKTLIQREWIFFGHKFNERNSLWPNEVSREFSPVFLQWLDCVFQLQQQFPDLFEFNELFLIKLATHISSGLFGTFNHKVIQCEDGKCIVGLWNFLSDRSQRCFLNPLYNPIRSYDSLLKPRLSLTHIRLWTALYSDSLGVITLDDDDNNHLTNTHQYNNDLSPVSKALEAGENSNNPVCNSSMINSLMIVKENYDDDDDDEDYIVDGDDDDENNKLTVKNEISICDTSSFNESKRIIRDSPSSFFKLYCLRHSLESGEFVDENEFEGRHRIENINELDIDGLFHQRDLINIYSNIYRENRQILMKKIDYFKGKCRQMFEKLKHFKNLNQQKCQSDESSASSTESLSRDTNILNDNDSQFINNSLEVDDLDIIPNMVYWMPNHLASKCPLCDISFGLLTRKHHCRSCGLIFCSKCSSRKCEIPKENINWPERVCRKCYENICEERVSMETNSNTQSTSNKSTYSNGWTWSYFWRLSK